MGEIAVNQNSTIILPVPIDLIRPFMEATDGSDGASRPPRREEEEAERLYEEAVGETSSGTDIPDGEGIPGEVRSEGERA